MNYPAFDALGFPLTNDGASSVVPGLYFCGVHFLRTRKSATLFGVGEDAAIVAQSIAMAAPGFQMSSPIGRRPPPVARLAQRSNPGK